MRIWYIDTTLRDGEQAPGVSFSHEEKMNIAAMLNDLGIDEVEAGTPIMGKSSLEIIHDISFAGFNFKTTSWCRSKKEDLLAAIKAGSDGVNISFPVSSSHLEAMDKSKGWLFANFPQLLEIANDFFEYTAIGLQDASRTDYGFLKEFIEFASAFEIERFRIADTVGCMNPFQAQELFKKLTTDFPHTNFEFHGHNDLGMATANSLSAVLYGANCLSTTINGLGERAGNTPLDEVVMALKYSANIEPTINTDQIQKISNYVAKASRREIPESKPITGRKVFQHESGIHTRSLLKNKTTYQIIDETITGRSEKLEIVYGKHSGSGALKQFYSDRGLFPGTNILSNILEQIKIHSTIKKDNLAEEELMNMYYQLT